MEVWLNDKYVMLSDRHQYILGEKWKDGRILHIGFYVAIEDLLKEYVSLRCRTEKDITTARQLLDFQKSILTSLNKAIQPLKIEVIEK